MQWGKKKKEKNDSKFGFRFDSGFHTEHFYSTNKKNCCGVGGLGGCMMSSHRNKCHDIVGVAVNESIVSF